MKNGRFHRLHLFTKLFFHWEWGKILMHIVRYIIFCLYPLGETIFNIKALYLEPPPTKCVGVGLEPAWQG